MSDVAKRERKLCFEILFASVAAGGASSEVLAHAAEIELGRELEQVLGVDPISASSPELATSTTRFTSRVNRTSAAHHLERLHQLFSRVEVERLLKGHAPSERPLVQHRGQRMELQVHDAVPESFLDALADALAVARVLRGSNWLKNSAAP